MSMQNYGSVVALEFRTAPSIKFADIVEEFDIAFQMVDSMKRSLTWDGDDVAIIDRDYVRVAMGWLPGERQGRPWHLIIAVGSAPGEDLSKIELSSYDFVADRILERTQEYMPSTAVLRGRAFQPVGVNLVETLFDLLAPATDAMPGDTRKTATSGPEIFDRDAREYVDMVNSMSPPWAQAEEVTEPCQADHQPTGFAARTRETMANLGSESLVLGQSECSKPMRLTIHTLALSICLYAPPLGAAMFTYSMMRDIFPVAAQAV